MGITAIHRSVVPDLDDIRIRLYDLRLYGPEALCNRTRVTIADADEVNALAALVGEDVPALIAAVEALIARVELAEGERDALRQAVAVRTPQRCNAAQKPEVASNA